MPARGGTATRRSIQDEISATSAGEYSARRTTKPSRAKRSICVLSGIALEDARKDLASRARQVALVVDLGPGQVRHQRAAHRDLAGGGGERLLVLELQRLAEHALGVGAHGAQA